MRSLHTFLLTLAALLPSLAHAGYVPAPRPLAKSLADADTIAVATLVSFTPQPGYVAPTFPPEGFTTDAALISRIMELKPPGTYTFTITHTLAGNLPQSLTLDLPPLLEGHYSHTAFPLTPNSQHLLLLKHTGNVYKIVEELRPLIPLSPTALAELQEEKEKIDPLSLILRSARTSSLRLIELAFIDGIVDPRIPPEAAKYIADPDMKTRDHALLCLATNQDLRAIPLIAQFEKDSSNGANCVLGLQCYTSKDALPLLNPLIATGANYTRINAIYVIERLADRTSIPFLIQALDNDDTQHIVAYSAYCTLCRRGYAPRAPALTKAEFSANRPAEVEKIKTWWASEATKLNQFARRKVCPCLHMPFGAIFRP